MKDPFFLRSKQPPNTATCLSSRWREGNTNSTVSHSSLESYQKYSSLCGDTLILWHLAGNLHGQQAIKGKLWLSEHIQLSQFLLGFIVHSKKSILCSSQETEVLGMWLNLVTMEIKLPGEKIKKIR